MFVKEAYLDSLRNEESALAHYIHHLLAEKKISLDDDMSKLDFKQADHQKVKEMIQNNVLGIYKRGVYSLKMDQKTFVFIFAASQHEAIEFYTRTFDHIPLNCHEYPLDFQFTRGNEILSFRDMKKECKGIPAIAGYFNKLYC
jgi:uncharacterized glyoxalase superfamily protein PhnB